jgi:tetratricopeptide (TPR) repeat protein/nucleoside phosphorylase
MARCDVVIITIREDENLAVLSRLPNREFLPGRNRTYTVAKLRNSDGGEYSVAIVRTPEQGQNAAHDTARDAIEDLDPRWLMVVGIAGAMPDREFTLGDVIVGSRLHDFTVGAYIEGAPPEVANQGGPMTKEVQDLVALIPALGEKLSGWESAAALRVPRPSVSVSAANLYGNKSWKTKTKSTLAFHFETAGHRSHPIATTRAIASSGYLIKDTQIASTWRTASRDVMAVEMELAGVYAAAQRRAKEYSIIAVRGISDIVGFKREPEWTAYACQAAASFCISLLQHVPAHFLQQPSRGPTPSALSSVTPDAAIVNVRSNVPALPNIALVGRENDLEQMLALLGDPRKERVLVLHGHSGTGKSELAKEFARRHAGQYPGGMFVLDASSGALGLEFARIGETLLDLEFPNLSLPLKGEKVFGSLGVAPILLVYDNANSIESLSDWLPRAGRACHVLITTVQDRWDNWLSLEVKPLSLKDSLKLIEQLGGQDVAARYALASFAGGLPIQICSAAVTLARDQRRGNLPSTQFLLAPEADRSFRLVYENLEEHVRLLLHSAAFLNTQRLARVELFGHFRAAIAWNDAEFKKALDGCFDLHLLEGGSELKMHQLFAHFLQKIPLAQAQAELLKKVRTAQAERLIELAREVGDHPNRTDLASTLITFPLAPTAWSEAGVTIDIDDGEIVGSALYEIGRFDDARTWFERAVAAREKGDVDGAMNHHSLSSSLYRVGHCLIRTGKYAEAQSWFERAVAIAERGDVNSLADHQAHGARLHHVGVCLFQTGKYAEARGWFERAVAESEEGDAMSRVNHEGLSNSLHYVGACLWETNKFPEAQDWFERAVAEAEKGDVHGRVDHDSLGRSLGYVGNCLAAVGKYRKALPWFERAIAAKEKGDVHGRVDHDSLSVSLSQVGNCLLEEGKYAEAQEWYERAVADGEKGDVHGRINHEGLGINLRQLGYCLSLKENYAGAQSWYERAVEAHRKGDIFGQVDHASLAESLTAGAECLRKLGKAKEADAWEKEAAELELSADS